MAVHTKTKTDIETDSLKTTSASAIASGNKFIIMLISDIDIVINNCSKHKHPGTCRNIICHNSQVPEAITTRCLTKRTADINIR